MIKKIHQIWLGPHPLPQQHAAWAADWRRLHPHWDYKLWTDQDAEQFPLYQKLAPLAADHATRSDILRLCILREIGGLYIDTDFQPLRPTDALWNTSEFVTTNMPPNIMAGENEVTTGIMYSAPNSAVVAAAISSLEKSLFGKTIAPIMVANQLIKAVLHQLPSSAATIIPWQWLYPLAPGETTSKHLKAAFAAHHWEGSWITDANREKLNCKPRLTPLAAIA